jgi:hypothetical protein
MDMYRSLSTAPSTTNQVPSTTPPSVSDSSPDEDRTPPANLKKRFDLLLSNALYLHDKSAPAWARELVKGNLHLDVTNLNELSNNLLSKTYFINIKSEFCEKASAKLQVAHEEKSAWIIYEWFSTAFEDVNKTWRADLAQALCGKTQKQQVTQLEITTERKKILDTLYHLVHDAFYFTTTQSTSLQVFADKYYERMSASGKYVSNFEFMSSVFTHCMSVARADSVGLLEKRNVPFQIPMLDRLRSVRFLGDRIANYWKNDPSKVLILSGSSGCGKTIGALIIAKMNEDNVVFYLYPMRINAARTRHGDNVSLCTDSVSLNDRNADCVNFVMARIKEMAGDAPSFDTHEPKSNWNVFIIVDEIGAEPSFLRGLVASSDTILVNVHNLLFPRSQITRPIDSRVRIIAAGTGASYRTEYAASDPNRYDTFVFESEQRLGKLNYYEHLVETQDFGGDSHEERRIRALLLRVDQKRQRIIRSAVTIRYGSVLEKEQREAALRFQQQASPLLQQVGQSVELIQPDQPVLQSDFLKLRLAAERLEYQARHQLPQPAAQVTEEASRCLLDAAHLFEKAWDTRHDIRCRKSEFQPATYDEYGELIPTALDMSEIKKNYEQFKKEEWITPLEIEASQLVTNARCAALLVNLARDACKAPGRFPTSVATFNDMLRLWLPAVVREYVRLNGLSNEPAPAERLKEALTLTLFPVPFLPRALYQSLVTVGGVLVDLITTVGPCAALKNEDISSVCRTARATRLRPT